jgi:metal-responsive CopG/Arc/MetJ family transcriptional regulator
MKTVQVVLDDETLRAADREARRAKLNRSAIIRAAIRDYVRAQRIREMERRHHAGYTAHPVVDGEFSVLDGAQSWPDK